MLFYFGDNSHLLCSLLVAFLSKITFAVQDTARLILGFRFSGFRLFTFLSVREGGEKAKVQESCFATIYSTIYTNQH